MTFTISFPEVFIKIKEKEQWNIIAIFTINIKPYNIIYKLT